MRWQIELFFKIWKSQANIDKVKEMKLHRFECQLMAKLVWLIIHWKIFCYLAEHLEHNQKNKSCRVWKYYKHAFRINTLVRDIIAKPDRLLILLLDLTNIAANQFNLEEKNGKTAHYKTLSAASSIGPVNSPEKSHGVPSNTRSPIRKTVRQASRMSSK